jgi:putative membrane protein
MGMIEASAAVVAAWERGDMMDDGGGHWVWMVLVVVLVLAFLGALLWMVARRPSEQGGTHPTHSARQILAERLARGEITPEEYQERLRALG